MNPAPENENAAALRDTAARWTIRRDRGLSAAEAIEFELWLAADPRHAAAMRRAGGAWTRLDRLPDSAAQAAHAEAARRRGFWRRTAAATALAAAAALAFAAVRFFPRAAPAPTPASAPAGPRSLVLADGSRVHLNAGAAITEEFSAAERRVRLVRGEAHFEVARNAARPFVVRAGSVAVRAVGTAFNVTLQSAAVEVLVTEGVVQLDATATATASARAEPIPLLNPGQRAVVALAPVSPAAAVVVTSASTGEMARALAWQEPLLRLGGATLAELAAGFEARTGRRVVLADPALATLRLGGRFRADDIEGFASLLATTLGIDVERAADGAIVLRKKNPVPR
jgi:transmembrane sensor